MNKTKIEWVKNPDGAQGYTWNPITGCLNGCEYCYARKSAKGRLKTRYLANQNYCGVTNTNPQTDPFLPRIWPDRLNDLGNFDSPPKGIFVCSMGELFGDWIPREWQDEVMDCIKTYDNHRFYLLTKQPQNLIKFSPFPDNCWVGVTATDTSMFAEACYRLGKIKEKVKYISLEPLLDFKPREDALDWQFWLSQWLASGINWVIIGACTGTKKEMQEICQRYNLALMPYGRKWTAQPKIEWVKEIVEACDKAGIPVFLKNNLQTLLATKSCFGSRYVPLPLGDKEGSLRQEMPK